MDRVKGTIFNMLQNRLRLEGARVLDLFAGSGSLGFEAVSRGAESCVFVDSYQPALDMIEENGNALDCLSQCEIVQDDAFSFIARSGQSFDLVFADPPYKFEGTIELPLIIFQNTLIQNEGFLIIEHHKSVIIPPADLYFQAAQRQFGSTLVSFFTHPQPKKDLS
jgi:16S rRNA (guanine966-N2)-methyltransferase